MRLIKNREKGRDVSGRSNNGIACSNSVRGMDICQRFSGLLFVLCRYIVYFGPFLAQRIYRIFKFLIIHYFGITLEPEEPKGLDLIREGQRITSEISYSVYFHLLILQIKCNLKS
jgi:hypothetical protein